MREWDFMFFCICDSSANIHFLPYLHYFQSFVGDGQCTACCSWESIRCRSYSRVQVACIDNIAGRDPTNVLGRRFFFMFVLEVLFYQVLAD